VTAHKAVKLKGASNDYAKSGTKGSSNGIGSVYRLYATIADWSCPRTTLRSRSRSRMAVRGRAIPLGSSSITRSRAGEPSTLPNSSTQALKGGDIRVS